MSVIYQPSPSRSYIAKWSRKKLWCILQLLLILVVIPLPAFPQKPFRKKPKEVKLRSSKPTHLQLFCNHSHPKESILLPWLESKPRETSLCEYYPHLLLSAVLMILCVCVSMYTATSYHLDSHRCNLIRKTACVHGEETAQSNLDSATAVLLWLFRSTV